jgi:hypothetical protein
MDGNTAELQQTIRLARWSAALGTIGLVTAVFGVGVLLALAAIACAAVALNQLSATPAPDGHGIAVVGLLAGVLALLIFPLLLATAVPRFIAATRNSAHERCYANLLAIDAAKEQWAQRHNAARAEPVTVVTLLTSGALPEQVRCPSRGRYMAGPAGAPARCSVTGHNEPPGPTMPPRQLRFSAR